MSRAVLPVRVMSVIDAPAVGGLDGHSGDWGRMSGMEDQPIALRLDPGLRDPMVRSGWWAAWFWAACRRAPCCGWPMARRWRPAPMACTASMPRGWPASP
ncbi:hypothetical protein ACFQU7_15915 [Pseudoroseomonas wenyumeiae]